MLSYCLKCGEITKSTSPSVLEAINGRTIILSKCLSNNTINNTIEIYLKTKSKRIIK